MRVTYIFMPQFQNKENTKMPVIKRSTLPVLRIGKVSTEPTVSVSEGGQIRFNRLALEMLNGSRCFANWDADKRIVQLIGCTDTPKNLTEGDLWSLLKAKGKDAKGAYMSAAQLLRFADYNYKTSGNQHMKNVAVVKTKAGQTVGLSFTLPKGALVAPPKQTRVSRKVAAVAPTAQVASAARGDATDIDLGID